MNDDQKTQEIYKLQSNLQILQLNLRQYESQISVLNSHIRWMEGSKFWKLRLFWLKLRSCLLFRSYQDFWPLFLSFLKSRPTSPKNLSKSTSVSDSISIIKKQFTDASTSELNCFLATSNVFQIPSTSKSNLHTSSKPLVSIILVLFNRAELTYRCLRSLCELQNNSFELIIWDNASTDKTHQLLKRVDGAKVIYHPSNIHFLAGVNKAAEFATGKYILILNNDVQILPGSLDVAINTLNRSSDIGAVGGKILLLDGSLQEAGSIIWQDGSCAGYGRNDNPLEPMYMFQRDVDYCSGAFLLTPRSLFQELGGFDNRYEPAYYEETDYCLRLWKYGKRIVYNPNIVIVHYEFASSNNDSEAIDLQNNHRQIFLQEHSEFLHPQYLPHSSNQLLARSRRSSNPRILFIEDRVPHLTLGSGFPRSNKVLHVLDELGCLITLYPIDLSDQESWNDVYLDIPNTIEVMLGGKYGSHGLKKFLNQRQNFYDIIWVSRPSNLHYLINALSKDFSSYLHAKIVYDAEAIFALREIRQQQLLGASFTPDQIQMRIEQEINLANVADIVLSVSDQEKSYFQQTNKIVHVLGHSLNVKPTLSTWQDRKNFLFVGSVFDENSPNSDALSWFISSIFPLIQAKLGKVSFLIAGINRSRSLYNLANESVIFLGVVPDLRPLYAEARVFIAPTRFAAGIPHKVHEAAAYGVPIITTQLIANQLGWQSNIDLIAADVPDHFADACIRLYSDPELWESIRSNAINRVKTECSESKFKNEIIQILTSILFK